MDLGNKTKTNGIKSTIEYKTINLQGTITVQTVTILGEEIGVLKYNYKETDMDVIKKNAKSLVKNELADKNNETSWYLETDKRGNYVLKHKKLHTYLWKESLELIKDTAIVGVTAVALWKLKNISKNLGTECWDSIRQGFNKIKAV